jgi:rfaE bifunctional protein kinase chain/domain
MLNNIIERFPKQKILVLGDLMLDEYLWGDVKRISPEAPVQVVDIQRETVAPGGACNVAVNVASLEGQVFLGGVIGRDPAGERLRNELEELGVDTAGLVIDPDRSTITKTRLVARNQQIVRYDRDVRTPLDRGVQLRLLEWVKATLPKVGLCIFSDYAKGISTPAFLAEFMALAASQQKPVLVDPKGNGFQKYCGAALITPNIQELEIASGLEIQSEEDLMSAYRVIRDRLPGTEILIKMGSRGMTLLRPSGETYHVEAYARQVFDVTGAGDTVIAAFAMALAAGAGFEECTRLANQAAGIVVGKVGTASVTTNELLKAIPV